MQKNEFDVVVRFKEGTHNVTVNVGSTYEQLVRAFKLNPEEVLVFADNISVPSDERVKPGEVRIIKIVSGG